jgi:hypothetical protein
MAAEKTWRDYVRRLSGMSAHEIYTRSRQELAKRGDVLFKRAGKDAFLGAGDGTEMRGRFFCDRDDVPRIVDILRERMPAQADRIVARAERILDRRFDLLGYEGLDFGRDIDWSLDPVHGKRAPLVPWPSVRYLDFAEVGDHKITWELNRHQFLITLAKAYRITGDARFASGLIELWYDWQRKNPYPMGVNWTSTLEVAFRAHSWLWVDFLLEGAGGDRAFERDLERETARAAWYIERYLSTYFAPNTHLLGEGVVLFLIGARYPGIPQAARWRQTGWRIVLEESRRQVRVDGLHFEQSIYYHVYAIDFFVYARLLAARNGVAIPAEFDETIRRMLRALADLAQAGALPRFGDDDGGRLFDGARNRAEEMLDPLSTGAVLFGDGRLKSAAPGLAEETLWLLGAEAAARFDIVAAALPMAHSVALADCGIYAMTSAGPPLRQLFIDGGEQGALTAGHGHADALSIQLAANGKLWLTDPGSFAYMGGERDRFRGTAAHNTLTVDGTSQADPRGPFGWGPRPRVEVRRWVEDGDFDLFEGLHSGYERLAEPVVHRRWVVGLREGVWLVRDAVEGSGTHDLEISLHFAPEIVVSETDAAGVTACWGGETLGIVASADSGWERRIEVGEYSPVYGVKVRATVVRWSRRAACPAEFAMLLAFGRAVGTLVRRQDDGGVVYEGGGYGFAFRTGGEVEVRGVTT